MTVQGPSFQSTIKHTPGVGCTPQDFLTKAARDVTLYPATDQSIPLSHSTTKRKQSHPCPLTVGRYWWGFVTQWQLQGLQATWSCPQLCQLPLVKPQDFLEGDKEKKRACWDLGRLALHLVWFCPLCSSLPQMPLWQPSRIIFAQQTTFAMQVTSGQAQPLQRAKTTLPLTPTEKTPAGIWTAETSSTSHQRSSKQPHPPSSKWWDMQKAKVKASPSPCILRWLFQNPD